jgi:hypothetical protein
MSIGVGDMFNHKIFIVRRNSKHMNRKNAEIKMSSCILNFYKIKYHMKVSKITSGCAK